MYNGQITSLRARTQFTKVGNKISGTNEINHSIVQGSGVGPCLLIILVSDIKPTGSTNHMVKYADDTSFLVIEKCSVSL